jgi:tRNA(fMet)-specific endonuclease VapC
MRYLLDTNICIYISKKKPAQVQARLERLKPGDVGMSVITYAELMYGAWKSEKAASNLSKLAQLRFVIPVEPLDSEVARHYGRLRAELEKKSSPIGAYDLLIAAHALSLGLTLVTNNVREFSRVPGLRVENWVVCIPGYGTRFNRSRVS